MHVCSVTGDSKFYLYQQVRDSLSKPTNRCFHHFCEKELFWTRQRVALSANGEATLHAQMLYWFENSLSVRIDFLCFPLSSCTEYCSENTRKAKWFNNHVTRPCYQYNEVRTLEHSPDVISKLFSSVKSQPDLMTKGLICWQFARLITNWPLREVRVWVTRKNRRPGRPFSDKIMCDLKLIERKVTVFRSRRNTRTTHPLFIYNINSIWNFKEYEVCEALSKQISSITSYCLMYTRCLNPRDLKTSFEKIFPCFPVIVQLYFLVNYKTKMFKFK